MPDIKTEHLIGAGVLLAGAGFFYAAIRQSGGPPAPATTESAQGQPTPNAPILLTEEFMNPVTYTAHRYPRICGQEITTLIHRGHTAATVPASDPEATWIIKPPSELVL